MTKEEIIELARQVGMMSEVLQLGRNLELLTDFARLVAEKEREACAKVCEEQMEGKSIWIEGSRACSIAIRAKVQE